jgi:hypothetical protein
LNEYSEPSVAGAEFDDTDRRVARQSRRLLELGPAAIVSLDLVREPLDEVRSAHRLDDALDVADADVIDHTDSSDWGFADANPAS